MKAKELAREFKESGYADDKLTDILDHFLKELGRLMTARKVSPRNPRAILAVYEEVRQKWRAFARRVNEDGQRVSEDGFDRLVEHALPEIHSGVMELRKAAGS
jgi:hypothetical protein